MSNYHFPSLRTDGLTLVLGLGESGIAAARWCIERGVSVRLADTRASNAAAQALQEEYPQQVSLCLGPQAVEYSALDGVHTLVISPGLSPEQAGVKELLAYASQQGIDTLNETELFARALNDMAEQGYQPKVVAITGTNGKTTVTALTRFMFECAGMTAVAAGNISPATIAALRQHLNQGTLPEAWVLELSSFQLHSLRSLRADAACVLNISQDHLDWHGSMQAYVAEKARVFSFAKCHIVNRDDSATVAMVRNLNAPHVRSIGAGAPLLQGDMGLQADSSLSWIAVGEPEPDQAERQPAAMVQPLIPGTALRIRGQHNLLNAQAALALVRAAGIAWEPALDALRKYAGEPHRVELIRHIQGVQFINDSKGTNVGSTVAALQGFDQPMVLIAGGEGKGQDFTPLAQAVAKSTVVTVVLIGRDAPVLEKALQQESTAPIVHAASLDEAVRVAYARVPEHGMVLLSPACASFDMFKSYEHRGHCFVEVVQELALDEGEVA